MNAVLVPEQETMSHAAHKPHRVRGSVSTQFTAGTALSSYQFIAIESRLLDDVLGFLRVHSIPPKLQVDSCVPYRTFVQESRPRYPACCPLEGGQNVYGAR